MRFGPLLAGAGLAVSIVFAATAPAGAKGISGVIVDGEAMAAPVELDAQDLRDLDLGLPDFGAEDVVDHVTRPGDQSRGAARVPQLLESPPTSALGPALTVTWTLYGLSDTAQQELYPYASGGPLVHTEPGQTLYGTALGSGWFRADDDLVTKLQGRGLPDRARLTAARAAAGTGTASPSDRPARPLPGAAAAGDRRSGTSSAGPWRPPVAAVVAVVLLAAVAAGVTGWERRRRHRQTAAR